MTHKYLNQIRTVPNYHDDQSDFAKTWRSISYTFKSASNLLIKNKKTRIITSVLAVYMILTSGFVVAFINVDHSQVNAQNSIPSSDLDLKIIKKNIEGSNITLSLEVQNKTSQTLANPFFQLQSSFDNITWLTSTNEQNNNRYDAQNSGFRLSNINPSQKAIYSIYGQLKNYDLNNIAVMANVSYSLENKIQAIDSPKFLIELK